MPHRRSYLPGVLLLFVLLLPAGPALAQDLTGTWTGGPFVLQLHERTDGAVLAYDLGGSPIVAARRVGNRLYFSVDQAGPEGRALQVVSGTIDGDSIQLDPPVGPMTLARTAQVFDERRYVALPMSGGGGIETVQRIEFDVALVAGSLVRGTFQAAGRCDVAACGGEVTNLAETPATDALQVDLSWAGSCPGTATLDTTFDIGQGFWVGSYDALDCGGPRTGTLAVTVMQATQSDHVAEVLAAVTNLADDVEAGASFGGPHASVAGSFLHDGLDEAGLRQLLDAQSAAWSDLEHDFYRIDGIRTVQHPRQHPFLDRGFGIDLFEERSGSRSSGAPTAFRSSAPDVFHEELAYLTDASGSWQFDGNQDPHPAGIRMPFDPGSMRYAYFGAWPFGAHGGGHPEGHPGIDFELDETTTLVAVRSGTIVEIEPNWLTPDQINIVLQSGRYKVQYHHVDADTMPGIVQGAEVVAGQALGSPGAFCCDPAKCCEREGCAPGGEATCCATNYPGMGSCDRQENPDYHHLIHFGVSGSIDDTCPWDVMHATARAQIEAAFEDASYAEQLTEPFLCNDPERLEDAMPFVTRWQRTTNASAANPPVVVIDRSATYGDPDYRFLDENGATVSSGIVCANDPDDKTRVEFIEGGTDCHAFEPGTVTLAGTFVLDGAPRDAAMTLQLSGGQVDTYLPEIADSTGAACGPDAGVIDDLRVERSGATLQLTWSDPADADDFVVFESPAANGSFHQLSGTAGDGTSGLSVALPGRVRFFRVVPRNAACGLRMPDSDPSG